MLNSSPPTTRRLINIADEKALSLLPDPVKPEPKPRDKISEFLELNDARRKIREKSPEQLFERAVYQDVLAILIKLGNDANIERSPLVIANLSGVSDRTVRGMLSLFDKLGLIEYECKGTGHEAKVKHIHLSKIKPILESLVEKGKVKTK